MLGRFGFRIGGIGVCFGFQSEGRDIIQSVATQPVAGSLGGLDALFVGGAVALLFVISYVFGRREENTDDFFLGGRRVPWIVACLSFVATEISALALVGMPHTAYTENWRWFQFLIGLALARLIVAFLFIPAFYKYDCTSIYEFLGHRFGRATQYTGSIYFLVTRLIASGVRLYATCMAVGLILGWPLGLTLAMFTVVSVVFIAFGGIKALVWTGAYQAVFFIVSGVLVAVFLVGHIDGGLASALDAAGRAGRLSTFNFAWNLNDANTFWAGVIGGLFTGLVSFGADQEMVQRLLTVKTRKSSQRTILATIVTVLPVYWLYLLIGTLLYVFYGRHPELPLPTELKTIFPHFARTILPAGLKGLVLASIVLASVDSPLNSLTTSFVRDIYRPLICKNATERHYLLVSRIGVVVFGLILAAIAMACEPVQNILGFAFQILALTGGPMLGVFLLGLLTRRKVNLANVPAMLISTALCTVLLFLIQRKTLDLGWTWLIVLGAAATMGLSGLFSLLNRQPRRRTR
ncbi:MAG: sodium/solute symporter [Planctomycetes bacterium]|nr:sodium/solute symporter [Planctomycetota bacterium]